jgi:hypothetical protein
MSITLGKDAQPGPPTGIGITDIISATYTEECEVIDVTNRSNITGATGAAAYRANAAGFKTKTWEIECHSASGVIEKLVDNPAAGNFTVMSVSENISIDGAVTFTVTAKEA